MLPTLRKNELAGYVRPGLIKPIAQLKLEVQNMEITLIFYCLYLYNKFMHSNVKSSAKLKLKKLTV